MNNKAILILLFILIISIPLTVVFSSPITIDTTTDQYATAWSYQRKIHFANGYYWAFFFDGSNFRYSSSEDKTSWSAPTTIDIPIPSDGRTYDTSSNSTHVFIIHATNGLGGNHGFYYKLGIYDSGTITWYSTVEVDASTSAYFSPSCSFDSEGYPLVVINKIQEGQSSGTEFLLRNSKQDGTWITGKNITLASGVYMDRFYAISSLKDQKAYIAYQSGGTDHIRGAIYDGIDTVTDEGVLFGYVWPGGDTDMAITTLTHGSYDDVLIATRDVDDGGIYVRHRNYNGQWSGLITATLGTPSGTYPSSSTNNYNDTFYIFWINNSCIYYRSLFAENNTWTGSQQLLYDDSANGILTKGRFSTVPIDNNGEIGLLYSSKTSSPYDVNFLCLLSAYVPPPPPEPYYMIFAHRDLDNNSIDLRITWVLYNGTQALAYTEGDLSLLNYSDVEGENFTLNTYYHSIILLNTTNLSLETYGNTTILIYMQMKEHTSLGTWDYAYVAFNNTISSISIISQTETNLTFTVDGSTPVKFIVDVPREPIYFKRNGFKLTGWVYHSDKSYIEYDTNQFSTYEAYCPYPPTNYPQWTMLMEVIALSIVFSFAGFFGNRIRILSMIGSVFLMILGIYMTVTRYAVFQVEFVNEVWQEYVKEIPYYPQSSIFIALIGVILFISSVKTLKW